MGDGLQAPEVSDRSHRTFMQPCYTVRRWQFGTSVKQRLYARGLSGVKDFIREQGGYLLPNSAKVLSEVFSPQPRLRQDPNPHLPSDVTPLNKQGPKAIPSSPVTTGISQKPSSLTDFSLVTTRLCCFLLFFFQYESCRSLGVTQRRRVPMRTSNEHGGVATGLTSSRRCVRAHAGQRQAV